VRTEKETLKTYLKLVGFRLGLEEYAVDILKIKEIKLLMEITRVPKAPSFVEGVINLRGDIVPIIDLRKKLRLPTSELGEDTRIIIVEIESKMCGVIVDGVSEVIEIEESKILPPPSIVKGSIDSAYLKGVGKMGDRILILLDLDKILTTNEREILEDLDDMAPGQDD
jgi:purine-binding chemotaxis protein CheW